MQAACAAGTGMLLGAFFGAREGKSVRSVLQPSNPTCSSSCVESTLSPVEDESATGPRDCKEDGARNCRKVLLHEGTPQRTVVIDVLIGFSILQAVLMAVYFSTFTGIYGGVSNLLMWHHQQNQVWYHSLGGLASGAHYSQHCDHSCVCVRLLHTHTLCYMYTYSTVQECRVQRTMHSTFRPCDTVRLTSCTQAQCLAPSC